MPEEMRRKWVTLFGYLSQTRSRPLFILISGSQLQATTQTIEHPYRFPIPHYERCNKLEGGGGRKFAGRKIVDPSTPPPKILQLTYPNSPPMQGAWQEEIHISCRVSRVAKYLHLQTELSQVRFGGCKLLMTLRLVRLLLTLKTVEQS